MTSSNNLSNSASLFARISSESVEFHLFFGDAIQMWLMEKIILMCEHSSPDNHLSETSIILKQKNHWPCVLRLSKEQLSLNELNVNGCREFYYSFQCTLVSNKHSIINRTSLPLLPNNLYILLIFQQHIIIIIHLPKLPRRIPKWLYLLLEVPRRGDNDQHQY